LGGSKVEATRQHRLAPRAAGKAVICISHDLEFVFRHADRITVLRLGRSVGTREVAGTSRDEVQARSRPADRRPPCLW